jgi:hypothetical protein
MKVYVLTSRDIERLGWIEEVIPQRETVVVINSLDPDYGAVASKWCEERGYEYHITESDGTPATGKNSVIKLFLESGEDYMVAVDGDDILTRYGYKLYTAMAESGKAPDMVALYRQPQIKALPLNVEWGGFLDRISDLHSMPQSLKAHYKLTYPWDKSPKSIANTSWQNTENLYNVFRQEPYNQDEEKALWWAHQREKFNHLMIAFSEAEEFMCRMVFFSKEIAKEIKYDNSLMIGEDTYQFLRLKLLHQAGEYRIARRKEKHFPTYIAIASDNSVTLTEGLYNYDWLEPLNQKIKGLKALKPKTQILEIIDGTYL